MKYNSRFVELVIFRFTAFTAMVAWPYWGWFEETQEMWNAAVAVSCIALVVGVSWLITNTRKYE